MKELAVEVPTEQEERNNSDEDEMQVANDYWAHGIGHRSNFRMRGDDLQYVFCDEGNSGKLEQYHHVWTEVPAQVCPYAENVLREVSKRNQLPCRCQ